MDNLLHKLTNNAPDNDISPEKCRERRQRRLQNRRRKKYSTSNSVSVEVEAKPPVWGVVSISGRMRVMEDEVFVCMDLCRPEIAQFQPVHFFAVYDGHGGSHVSTLCKQKLHTLLKEELMLHPPQTATTNRRQKSHVTTSDNEDNDDVLWKQAFKRAFMRMDDIALTTCTCGVAVGIGCGCDCDCDKFATSIIGSTATVAVVTRNKIVVANCGDSRAVLCRGRGREVSLSADHKPDRPDELARIEAAGGRVMYLDGARVQGVLAMSRAIGDKFLKPIVISEPEITITRRDPEDECIILGSDGLWDVIPNHIACKVAFQGFQEGNLAIDNLLNSAACTGLDEECPTLSARVAALLTCLALGKDSTDNISVVVVDLKSRLER